MQRVTEREFYTTIDDQWSHECPSNTQNNHLSQFPISEQQAGETNVQTARLSWKFVMDLFFSLSHFFSTVSSFTHSVTLLLNHWIYSALSTLAAKSISGETERKKIGELCDK